MARPDDQDDDALVLAVDGALQGKRRALWEYLALRSHLPSPRANERLMERLAEVLAGRGKRADDVLVEMATLDADAARGGTEFEFVPMCGVLAAGVRAAAHDASYARMLDALHTAAEDLRFKVRDTVPIALAKVGAARGDLLVAEVASWMDGFFHAAAVLRAMAIPTFTTRLDDAGAALERVEQAFALLAAAPRSASRYPGFKALVDAVSVVPGVLAVRFGVPVFDLLARLAATKDPVLREAIGKNLGGTKLAGRHAADVARVRAALDASAPPRRDPLTYVGPTRGRGKSSKGRR